MTRAMRWCKEPLLHFLVLAGGVFALQHVWSPTPQAEQADEIVVSQERIRSLILTFQRTWQRPPTREELDGLIEDYIKEEVFYREALKMGLDQDDTLIRRRMRQKLEFLAEDFADAIEPSPAQLQEYLDAHPERFRIDGLTSFRQIFLNPRLRRETLVEDAEALLSELRTGDSDSDLAQLGDSILLPFENPRMRMQQIAGQFGPDFAEALADVVPGEWSGPIESAYGAHLVLVNEKSPGRLPQLDEVREAVRREWFADRRAASKQQFFDELVQKYDVRIEHPEPAVAEDEGAE